MVHSRYLMSLFIAACVLLAFSTLFVAAVEDAAIHALPPTVEAVCHMRGITREAVLSTLQSWEGSAYANGPKPVNSHGVPVRARHAALWRHYNADPTFDSLGATSTGAPSMAVVMVQEWTKGGDDGSTTKQRQGKNTMADDARALVKEKERLCAEFAVMVKPVDHRRRGQSHEVVATLAEWETHHVKQHDEPQKAAARPVGHALEEIAESAANATTRPMNYSNMEQIYDRMHNLHAAYPGLTALHQFGRSIENRSLLAIKISAVPGENRAASEAREIVLVGVHHAREWISSEVPMSIAEFLCRNYHKNARIRDIVNQVELWVIPVLNPDGYAFTHEGGRYNYQSRRMWRKNKFRYKGTLYGVDLNRNYPVMWGDLSGSSSTMTAQDYHGTAPFSEPETTALKDFLQNAVFFDKPGGFISYHSYGEMILHPLGYSQTAYGSNEAMLQNLSTRMATVMRDDAGGHKYRAMKASAFYPVSGDAVDWFYESFGNPPCFTIELRPFDTDCCAFTLPVDKMPITVRENVVAGLFYIETVLAHQHNTQWPTVQTIVDDKVPDLDEDGDGIVDYFDPCLGHNDNQSAWFLVNGSGSGGENASLVDPPSGNGTNGTTVGNTTTAPWQLINESSVEAALTVHGVPRCGLPSIVSIAGTSEPLMFTIRSNSTFNLPTAVSAVADVRRWAVAATASTNGNDDSDAAKVDIRHVRAIAGHTSDFELEIRLVGFANNALLDAAYTRLVKAALRDGGSLDVDDSGKGMVLSLTFEASVRPPVVSSNVTTSNTTTTTTLTIVHRLPFLLWPELLE